MSFVRALPILIATCTQSSPRAAWRGEVITADEIAMSDVEFFPDVRVVRTCKDGHCVEALHDGARVLFAPRAEAGVGVEVDRSIRVTEARERFISVRIAETSFAPGAAHHNHWAGCATFDRASGRRLALRDVIEPAAAKRILARVKAWRSDANAAIDALGDTLVDCTGCEASEEGFRIAGGQVVLCLDVPVPGAGMGEIHEVLLDGLPMQALLGP